MFTQTVSLKEFMIANKAKSIAMKLNKSTGKTFGVIGDLTALVSNKIKAITADNFNDLSVSWFESEDGVEGWMVHPNGGAETISEFSLEFVMEEQAN
jgi:hypothetical protein